MHRPPLVAAATAAAVLALPASATAEPLGPTGPAVHGLAGRSDADVVRRLLDGAERLERTVPERPGAPAPFVVGGAPEAPWDEVPFSPLLTVGTPTSSTLVRVARDGSATGTATSERPLSDLSSAPGGDAEAYRTVPSDGTTRVAPLLRDGGATSLGYPASDVPVAWSPAGDGFVTTVDGRLVARSTNPRFSTPIDVEDATAAAVSPYGGELFVRRQAEDGPTLVVGPAPFSGFEGTTSWTDLGLSAYSPGAPAVGQEPGLGVFAGDELTYLAFTGTDPADGTAHLYVDHQDDFTASGYGSPERVADVGAICGGLAPAFSPDRRMLAHVVAVGPTGAECSELEVHVRSLGTGRRYRASTPDHTVWTVPAGTPVTSLDWRAQNPAAAEWRLDGAHRYEVSAFTAFFYDPDSVDAVVLAGGRSPADALTAVPLAAALGGPVVLTRPTVLGWDTLVAIESTLAPGGTVHVVGGTASVSPRVVRQLREWGYTVRRTGGETRYDVAANVARRLDVVRGGSPDAAFVASGTAFTDALVAGPAAASLDAPVLLSRGSSLPAATRDYLASLGTDAEVFAVGGEGADSVAGDPRTEVVGGATRYEVAGNVADRFFAGWSVLALADGRSWPDAVSGGALMASVGQPLLLTRGRTLPEPTRGQALRTRASLDLVLAFGGSASVPQAALDAAVVAAGDQTTYFGLDLP
ncbi:cell wall-binding repeat-containing protein [Phycicoccus sp. BSK3Z-2]|uniref:Cell wall-binding repeat-containing protein n=1 Tax=Phycicoccus avicenniae TaxID=2828860 RepID=A0A941D6V9_9MICO|nr:cell wall-binding repeat-containing protein [Phycicoccus avicenniae]MBR7742945.1 cell wall-binding repeat-containing protein [Phycicoccus avicenniae]